MAKVRGAMILMETPMRGTARKSKDMARMAIPHLVFWIKICRASMSSKEMTTIMILTLVK